MAAGLLRVGMLQLSPAWSMQESLEAGLQACRQARDLGAELAVFPELWNTGYRFPPVSISAQDWNSSAIDESSAYFQAFVGLATEIDLAIALTYLRTNPNGAPLNSVSIIGRDGQTVLTYDKVHTCDFDKESLVSPGSDFPVCDLETASGTVKTGAMICYDREFPESARILMLNGAEIIVIPNACVIDDNRMCQLRTRAFENMVGCVMVNYAGDEFGGRSAAFDGIAVDKPEEQGLDGNPRDMRVVELDDASTVSVATIDLRALRDYRAREVWGDAYRKPSRYAPILQAAAADPFCRADSRRGHHS